MTNYYHSDKGLMQPNFSDLAGNPAATSFPGTTTNGFVLTLVSGIPTWASAGTATNATNLSSGAAGQIPYQSAASTTLFSAAGTSGQVLVSGGTGSPTWTGSLSLSALTLTGALLFNTAAAVSAAGTTQGNATALTADVNAVTTVASGTGVVLPANVGQETTVFNRGANALLVYPASSAKIDGASTNAAVSVPVNGWVTLQCVSSTQYLTADPVTVAGTNIAITQSNNGTLTIAVTGTVAAATAATNLSSGAAGQLPYQSAASTTLFSAAGTTGQVLLSGGTGSPTWSGNLSVGASGNITTTAPSSGTGLVVNAVSGANAIQFQDEGGTTQDAGYRGLPQNLQSGTTYTAVLADRGKHLYGTNASAKTFTIPANASVAYPIGTTLTFVNNGAGAMTIAITTDVMYLGGIGTTGSRTLVQYGIATATKIDSTHWIISGVGLT